MTITIPLKSIISHVGGKNFARLRLGIGKSGGKNATIGHVLGKFSGAEKEALSDLMVISHDAIVCSLREGVEKSMSLYNKKEAIVTAGKS